MNKILIVFFFFIAFYGKMVAQKAEVMTFEQFEQRYMKGKEDTLYVLNFWATWCKPCVEELPFFERANKEFKGKPVKVVLASLDFPKQLESRLNPYLIDNKIQSKVLLLNAPHENIWIPKVDGEWSGAIPATLFINPKKGTREFHEKSYTWEELLQTINNNLKL